MDKKTILIFDMHRYQAFGLILSSEWPIFQLEETRWNLSANTDPDVVIEYGHAGDYGYHSSKRSVKQALSVNKHSVFLCIDGVATFVMSQSERIIVDLSPGFDTQTVNLYLLGSCLGIILHQRGLLPLHGNAININDNAVVVVAHSGVGKSTLASEFFRQGYSLLADDVCAIKSKELLPVITNESQQQPYVLPGYPYLKLWQESIDRLPVCVDELVQINAQNEKFYVPVGAQFQSDALPLRAIYFMTKDDIEQPEMNEVTGVKKILRLRQFIYRLSFLRKMVSGVPALERILGHLRETQIFNIRRPRHGMHVETIAQMIIEQEHSLS